MDVFLFSCHVHDSFDEFKECPFQQRKGSLSKCGIAERNKRIGDRARVLLSITKLSRDVCNSDQQPHLSLSCKMIPVTEAR